MKWLLALMLTFCSPAFAGELYGGVGGLVNNVNSQRVGWLVDARYRSSDFDLAITRVNDSYLGAEMAATASYLFPLDRRSGSHFYGGVGAILAFSVRVPDWWFTSHDRQGWGLNGACTLCGITYKAGWNITPKWNMEVRYWGTEYFRIPSHNGALVVISYKIN